MKKFLALLLALSMVFALAACGEKPAEEAAPSEEAVAPAEEAAAPADEVTIQVAAIQTAYMDEHPNMWQDICDAFTAETGIKVELTTDKALEDVIGPKFKAGKGPDFVHLAVGREQALTESFIKDEALLQINDILDVVIPGEDATVGEKVGGSFGNASTNPYGDERIYLAPMFLSPCGLFYSVDLFEEKGWEVPTNWEDMWTLAEEAKAEGMYLWSYPTHGYLQEFFFSLLYSVGGLDLFNAVTQYEEGVWDTPEGQQVLEIMYKLSQYTEPAVPANDSKEGFQKNQQLVIDHVALFVPNGTWLPNEMAKTTPEGFKWGMAPIPAGQAGGDCYALNWNEQCWIPASAAHPEEAKLFMAFMYSDKAAAIFAEAGAIQPVDCAINTLEGEMKDFYGIFTRPGVKSAVGAFQAPNSTEGYSTDEGFFAAVNSMVEGEMSLEEYTQGIIETCDALRAAKG